MKRAKCFNSIFGCKLHTLDKKRYTQYRYCVLLDNQFQLNFEKEFPNKINELQSMEVAAHVSISRFCL